MCIVISCNSKGAVIYGDPGRPRGRKEDGASHPSLQLIASSPVDKYNFMLPPLKKLIIMGFKIHSTKQNILTVRQLYGSTIIEKSI